MAGEWSVLHFNFSFFDFRTTRPLLLWPKEAFRSNTGIIDWVWDRRAARLTPRYDIFFRSYYIDEGLSRWTFSEALRNNNHVCSVTGRVGDVGAWTVGRAVEPQWYSSLGQRKTTKGRVDRYSSCNARRSQSRKEKATTLFSNPASPQDCVLFRNMVCFGCCDKAGSAIIIILILWWYFLFYWTFSC